MASKSKRKSARRRKQTWPEQSAPPGQPASPKPVPQRDKPPEPPWGSFPLTQITVLVGLILLVIGFVTGGITPMVAGLLLGSAGGLELSIREHFAGYRSHTTLLSGVVFMVVTGVSYFLIGWVLWVCLALGLTCFGVAFGLMRRAFQAASGGLSFRVR